MSFVWFNPEVKKINKITHWKIKPHRVRSYVIYHFDNTETIISCLVCGKKFEYDDLAFRGYKDRYGKIQIRPSSYDKVCFDCGIKHLMEITPKKLLPKFNQLYLENKNAEKIRWKTIP